MAAGQTKKYGKGAEPKKLSPEAEMRLQRQKAKKQYDKLTLKDTIHV